MSTLQGLPLLGGLIPEGLSYGGTYLIEFEPHSLWYDASFTLTDYALRQGIITQYHTFMRSLDEIRNAFRKLGLDVNPHVMA